MSATSQSRPMRFGKCSPAACLLLQVLGPGALANTRRRSGNHANAVNGTGRQAEFATGAVGNDDRVHELASANDGIDRAGIDAPTAADTGLFVDYCTRAMLVFTAGRVERTWGNRKQSGQRRDGVRISGWTAVDIGPPDGDGLGIGAAVRIAAPRALCLGKTGIDPVNQRAFDFGMHAQSIACARGWGKGRAGCRAALAAPRRGA